ncbi:sensor histidine kinase [Nitriliruptor alkaliphilus]|uniref:sensor histidine kinase n=1 Tax=Nitriliruptor alkaliphilus TaxID=427918 RepID=UPI000696335F|nr:ATP-binding protein [Nitriliruptor alkaliphilus]
MHATPTAAPVGLQDRLQAWLPRGQSLDDEGFAVRHRTLSVLLALHVPALFIFGVLSGQAARHALAEVALAGVMVGLAQARVVPRRLKGILVTAGLVWCSAVLVHFSGGLIEAHFHFFIILGFIALYQDWAAFGWAIAFTAISHGLGSSLVPDLMFNHAAAVERPWTWALIHAGAVLFAAVGQIIGWRHAETAQDRATGLASQLIREQAERQASYSRIYVNLARRNQSLLHRQVAVIDELELTEEDPETLRRLFTLDHLTTRIRRNAESLLVMAGEESPRQVSGSVSLADVARAAASEIEQYARADIRVDETYALAGTAVVDVTHLLAELIENATEYSSPGTDVRIGTQPTSAGVAILIQDQGIGMDADVLANANATLASPPELDDQVVRHLGFQVVGRLAAKLGVRVELRSTPGSGTTTIVELPSTMLTASPPTGPVTDAHLQPAAVQPVDAAASAQSPVTPAPVAAHPVGAPALQPAPVAAPPAARTPTPAVPAPAPVSAAPAATTPLPTASVPDLDDYAQRLLFQASVPPPRPPAPAPAPVPAPPVAHVPASAPSPAVAATAPRPAAPRPPTPPALAPTPVRPPAAGLPRRIPAASLSPELRDPVVPPTGTSGASAPEGRRALSAFQSAARAARRSDEPADGNGEVRQ